MQSSHDRVDPYMKFGFPAGFLCEKNPTKLHILELSQIVSHFVLTKFSGTRYNDYIHALPVDRVSIHGFKDEFHTNVFLPSM